MPKYPKPKQKKTSSNDGLSIPDFVRSHGQSAFSKDYSSDTSSDIEENTLHPNIIENLNNQFKKFNISENTPNTSTNSNNFDSNPYLNPNEMAQPVTALDIIKLLDPFDGTPGTLNRFVRNVDRIISLQTLPVQKELFTDLIRNKIKDKANELLISVGDPSDWAEIKSHLLTQFSDRRTQETILHKLNTICQHGKTLEQYYAEISDLQTALFNSVDPEKSSEYKLGQTEVYLSIVLKSFIAGLDSNLGYIVRSNNPANIKEAYDICLNEISMQSSCRDRNRLAQNFRQPISQAPTSNRTQTNNSPLNRNATYSFPKTPVKPYVNNPHRPPFQFNKPNFNPNANQQFKPQAFTNNNYKPTPMDTSSGNTRQVLHRPGPSNFFKPTGTPNFTSKELFNVNYYDNNYDPEQQYYNNQYYDQDHNENYSQEYNENENPQNDCEDNQTPEINEIDTNFINAASKQPDS